MEVLYRISEHALWDDGEMVIKCDEYRVLRRTPKGAWVSRNPVQYGSYGKDRFVLDGFGKRFAYPTKQDAMASFIIRKKSQIGHLEQQLDFARAALKGALAPDFELGKTFVDETLLPYHSY